MNTPPHKTAAKVYWYENPKHQPPPLTAGTQHNTGKVQLQRRTPTTHKTTIRDVMKKLNGAFNAKYRSLTIRFSHFTRGNAHPVFSITHSSSGQTQTFYVTGSGSPGTHRYIDNIAKEIRKTIRDLDN
jgi:hypothetical protein